MLIPNKSNFKFQELTPITGVKPYVIRFWETEFPEIAPITSDSGQKIYSRSDVEAIMRIKELLFDKKLSIPEARAAFIGNEHTSAPSLGLGEIPEELVESIRSGLDLINEIKFKRKW